MPIIQNSGTGKSRMVDEMAESIFTLPFRLTPTGVNDATYPASDEAIREHLTSGIATERPRRNHVVAEYLVFFASLFSVVAKEVNRIRGDFPRVSPSDWRDHLERDGKRASLYRLAVGGVSAILKDVLDKTRERIQKEIALLEKPTTRGSPPQPETSDTKGLFPTSPPKSREEHLMEHLMARGKHFRDCASEAVKRPIQQLQQAIGHPLEGADDVIVLYFDESHILFECKATDASTYYDGLFSAFDALKLSKIIGLFL